jgi:hypothetical protein
MVVWRVDGQVRFVKDFVDEATEGRAWASPVVADLVPERQGLEIAIASRAALHAYDKDGTSFPAFRRSSGTKCAASQRGTSMAMGAWSSSS